MFDSLAAGGGEERQINKRERKTLESLKETLFLFKTKGDIKESNERRRQKSHTLHALVGVSSPIAATSDLNIISVPAGLFC